MGEELLVSHGRNCRRPQGVSGKRDRGPKGVNMVNNSGQNRTVDIINLIATFDHWHQAVNMASLTERKIFVFKGNTGEINE